MWLVLGGPTPLLGPLPFPGKWDCFCCLSWRLAQSRLWQQGSSVFLGSSTALQVAEGKCLSHTGNRSLSTDGDEDKDRAGEDDPESPGMSPWSSISLCKAPRGPLSACRGVGALGGSVPAVALPRLRAGYKPTPALSSGTGTAVFPWQSLFVEQHSAPHRASSLLGPDPAPRDFSTHQGVSEGLSSPHRGSLPWRASGVSRLGQGM